MHYFYNLIFTENVCAGATPEREELGESAQDEANEAEVEEVASASAATVCLNSGNNTADIHG